MLYNNYIQIKLDNIVNNTESNIEGVKLYCVLDKYLSSNMLLLLEINNDMSLTSSFLNSSFGNIIDKYGYNILQKNIKIKTNKKQFERIKDYLTKYTEIYSAL